MRKNMLRIITFSDLEKFMTEFFKIMKMIQNTERNHAIK